jgi:hypothetical protein
MNKITWIALGSVAALTLFPLGAWAAFGRPSGPSDEELTALALPNGSEQEGALADGVVTPDELRTAIESARGCIEGQGVALAPEPDLSTAITAFTAASGLSASQVSGAVAECTGRYLQRVSLTWAAQQSRHDPNDPSFLSEFTACLVDRGYSLGDLVSVGTKLTGSRLATADDILTLVNSVDRDHELTALHPCERQFPDYFLLQGD